MPPDAPPEPDPVAEAVRLFNRTSYFESHDLFEEEWAGTRGVRREALKALVKLAAGMYHLQTSEFTGAESLLSSGLATLEALPAPERIVAMPPLSEPVERVLAKLRTLREGGEVEWRPEDRPTMVFEASRDPGTPLKPR